MTGGRILIFANGLLPDLEAARRLLQPGDFIICADGGEAHVRALGLVPDMVVGDLDSRPSTQPDESRPPAVEVRQYPRDKDETDLELALGHALERDPASVVIVGAIGGRIDHTLGNVSLLLDPRLSGRRCCLDDGIEQVTLCRDRLEISGTAADLVSLIPWAEPVTGVRTEGLRWPLDNETLYPGRSRGISNEMLGPQASVRVAAGLLLVVHKRVT